MVDNLIVALSYVKDKEHRICALIDTRRASMGTIHSDRSNNVSHDSGYFRSNVTGDKMHVTTTIASDIAKAVKSEERSGVTIILDELDPELVGIIIGTVKMDLHNKVFPKDDDVEKRITILDLKTMLYCAGYPQDINPAYVAEFYNEKYNVNAFTDAKIMMECYNRLIKYRFYWLQNTR